MCEWERGRVHMSVMSQCVYAWVWERERACKRKRDTRILRKGEKRRLCVLVKEGERALATLAFIKGSNREKASSHSFIRQHAQIHIHSTHAHAHMIYWLMIAFTICNSNLLPLLESLCSSNPCRFELSGFWVFCRNRTDDLGTDSPAFWPIELVLHCPGKGL